MNHPASCSCGQRFDEEHRLERKGDGRPAAPSHRRSRHSRVAVPAGQARADAAHENRARMVRIEVARARARHSSAA